MADQTFEATTRERVEGRLEGARLPGARVRGCWRRSSRARSRRGLPACRARRARGSVTLATVSTILEGCRRRRADREESVQGGERVRAEAGAERRSFRGRRESRGGGRAAIATGRGDRGRGGAAQGLVFGLSPDDVDWLRGTVVVRRQVKILDGHKPVFGLPKGGKVRTVPLPSTARDLLAASLAERPARPVTLPWGALDGEATTVRAGPDEQAGRCARTGTT